MTGMKLAHAATLALVGWYLMVRPMNGIAQTHRPTDPPSNSRYRPAAARGQAVESLGQEA
jgi:hypothetical protein